jgi:hypothetical protein
MQDWKDTFIESGKTDRARQRLRKERLRLLLKKWDEVVKTLLRAIAEITWHSQEQQWVLTRTVGQESDLFGIHWEAGLKESGGRTGYHYTQKTYYRVTLVTYHDFVAMLFVVECRDKNQHKNRRITANVSKEGIKAALLEAHRSGPALHHHVFERPHQT